jgi:hypothetical protein
MPLVLRLVKGSDLTYEEMDNNLLGLSNGSLWDLVALAAKDIEFDNQILHGDLLVEGSLSVRGATAPVNEQSANYNLALTDANGSILHPSSDNNPRTYTVPSNATVAFLPGTMILIVNRVNTISIVPHEDITLYFAGSGSTGTRTLAAHGVATLKKVKSTPQEWYVWGVGLT